MKPLLKISLAVLSALMLIAVWYSSVMIFLLFVAFVPLLLIEENYFDTKKNSFGVFNYAYVTFFLWNLVTTFWIYKATPVGAAMAVLANSALMAFVFWLYHLSRRYTNGKIGRYGFILWWITFEFLFFKTEISWPWLTLGNAFADNVQLIQWYEYTGVLGGSLWVLFANIIIVSTISEVVIQRRTMNLRLIANGVLFVLLISIPIIISVIQYKNYEEKGDLVEVVVLQPNIDPYHEKFGSMDALEQITRLLSVADNMVTPNTKYVVGPETAIVEVIWEEHANSYASVKMIKSFLKEHDDVAFVVGASTREEYEPNDNLPATAKKFNNADRYYDRFNTAMQITPYEIDFYHKSQLVLGVEKMPYYKYFKFLDTFSADLGGTVGSLGVQDEPSVFNYQGSFVAPIICYESIYGEYVTEYVKKGAGLLFIITNDGWWGDTPGYKQHLRYASLRAIENRRSIARSANTGISCFINQRGDILQATDWWVATAIRGELHQNTEITYYTENGDYLGRVATFFTVLMILLMVVTRIITKKSTY